MSLYSVFVIQWVICERNVGLQEAAKSGSALRTSGQASLPIKGSFSWAISLVRNKL